MVVSMMLLVLGSFGLGSVAAGTLPAGFQESVVFSELTDPTVVAFAPDGRVFVAEKSGLIKIFDDLSDTTPTVFADLRTNVYNFWDRGLLGMAIDPNFPTRPYVYVLYTYDALIGGTAPRWGSADETFDPCPTPPGATGDGCVVSARLSRLEAVGNVMLEPERVLIEDWCQQYPSHSIGSLAFGTDGALYVSGGDGASFNFTDYGQDGSPRNPCGDPPVAVGGAQTPPTAEGGALRSQDLETTGDPVGLDGAILRINPDTGEALPDNPLVSHPDPNARRIIAYGLRNPFRITARPGTSEIWVGDVGWNTWEEINRIVNPITMVENFGWPCYEGSGHQFGYEAASLNICENLYDEPTAVTPPFEAYDHNAKVVPGETCPTGSSSISGLAFYNGGSYPAAYNGALFFADYARDCIWVMFNVPSPSGPTTGLVAAYGFEEGSGTAVADASGNGHTGTIAGATRTTAGKYGNALSFDGVNDWVTIADTNLLDLNSGATLMAWVYSTTTSGVRDILLKEGPSVDIYNLYARNWRGLPESNVYVNGTNQAVEGAALPAQVWTHVAGTYNGSILRLYINGVEVAQRPVTGPIASSTGPVRIGGNSLWGEYFQGRIDEVRIYNRVLTASEVQTDMNTPLPVADPPMTKSTFVAGAVGPVDLKIGPGGDLFYVDLDGGTIRRIRFGTNQPPTAVVQATPLSGPSPLTVTFNGSGSSDPDSGDTIASYAWDLDGDGQFDDSTVAQPTFTYTVGGSYTTRLQVTDNHGASGISAPVVITVGTPPVAIINTPPATTTWQVDEVISFSGQGTDQDDGPLPAAALTWELILHHCPSNCHTHSLQDFIGVADGSFSAPDHEYPSHLELRLTVTDASGLQDTESVLLEPETVELGFQSDPAGLQLAFNSGNATTPFDRTVVRGSNNSLSAPSPQTLGGTSYEFDSWSDSGTRNHNITAAASATYTATYTVIEDLNLVAAYGFNEASGATVVDASGNGHTGTISGATRTASGRYGSALAFDGVNDWVTIADTTLLDLTTGMTVSAWVFPTAHGAGVWRNVLIKERPGGEVYNLYTNVDTNVPTVYVVRNAAPGTPVEARGTAQLPLNMWRHLAATYDGAMLRLFVNGVQVRSQAVSGALVTSTGALRIGGNSIWGEYFQGRIDEVRIYSRALTASELQADMNTPLP